MAYLAIARKYRPATFDEMVGQDHVTRTLRNAIQRGRIHHAWLFCGARGVGKTTAARALARALNCADGPTDKPCGVCPSCVDIRNGVSPDLIEIDGASNNSVDDVRELRETVRYAPTQGRYKIYLVDEVHMLSNAAFNALLKTLEEPPPHVVFLFATTEPDKLPETILSRVQRFDFKRIGQHAVVDRLRAIAIQEGASLSDAALRQIARASEGSMRDAQSLLDKVISVGGDDISDALVAETLGLVDRGLLIGMVEAMLTGDAGRAFDLVAQVHAYGFELSRFLLELLDLVRDATFLTLSEASRRHVDLPDEEKAALLKLAEGVPPEALSRLFSALLETHEQVVRAPRPRVVLEMAIARLASGRPIQPVGALVARLEQLERRLRQAGVSPSGPAPRDPPRRPAGPGTRAQRAPSDAPSADARPRHTRSERAPSSLPTLAADASDEARWAALCAAAIRLQPPADGFDAAIVRRDPGALVLTLPAGRKHALVRRHASRQDVIALVAHLYGPGTEVLVEESLASRRPGAAAEYEAVALQDPACQRLLRVLGAKLIDVEPDLAPPSGDPS